MLKAYKVKTYIAINDKPKRKIREIGYGLIEDELPRVITTLWSFQD